MVDNTQGENRGCLALIILVFLAIALTGAAIGYGEVGTLQSAVKGAGIAIVVVAFVTVIVGTMS